MAISMVFAVLIIANSVMQQIEENGDTMNRLVGLMLGLLVPACGYAGAKNANRSLLSCFWGCNAFSAVWSASGKRERGSCARGQNRDLS